MLTVICVLALSVMFAKFIKDREEREKQVGRGISIIIPFRCADKASRRWENFNWVKRYWKHHLPGCEIIQGEDERTDLPFSKSVAINNAVAKSSGDVLVIVDADGFIRARNVLYCVREIRKAIKRGHRLWFVPYRQFYRLTEEASTKVIESDPAHPFYIPEPPLKCDIIDSSGSMLGHWYGAMIQIMPREAFDIVGGWDERFRGWGGEDHSHMRAMDTLYWHHKTLPHQVLHLWHPMLGPGGKESYVHWRERMWENQKYSGTNDELTGRYYGANGDHKRMRKLVDEGLLRR